MTSYAQRLLDRKAAAPRGPGCDSRPVARAAAAPVATADDAPLPAALGDIVRTLQNPASPTADDKKFLLDAAFRHVENARLENPAAARDFKRTLLDYLWQAAPGLAPKRESFQAVFNYKLKAWTEAGGLVDALQDQRAVASGNFRKTDFSADFEQIRNEAILHDGNESLAYRKLRQAGKLSAEFVQHYKFNARRNKSYVPTPVRAAISADVKMCGPIHRGPHEAKMRGPYILRDWSGVAPGDWFSGDDVTWNHYFYFYDGEGKLHIERGECLVIHDLRTGYILDILLIAGKYNSRHIRKLLLKVHDRFGLPHLGFYFERGVWAARIITDIASKESLHWRETESGLAAYNLQVRHATTPRAKTIEGSFHIFQDRHRKEPGYVSGNERTHEMERMQDFLARARAGKVDPAQGLLSMDQWKDRLDTIFAEYNHDPQNGKMLSGQSPAEAWQAGLAKKLLRQLPETSRYLLGTHSKKVRVRQEGIVLTIGKNRLLYCNDQTGPLIGRDVLAFYNLECPDLLTVSDLNRQNYFTVKAVSLPAMCAAKEQFGPVHAQIAGHTRHAREIYGSIPRRISSTITRDTEASPETAALGEFHNAESARFKTEQSATTRALRKIQLTAAGRPIPANIRNPGRVLAGIELENSWRAEQDAAEFEAAEIPAPSFASAGNGSGEKTYTLDTAPGQVPSVALYWRLAQAAAVAKEQADKAKADYEEAAKLAHDTLETIQKLKADLAAANARSGALQNIHNQTSAVRRAGVAADTANRVSEGRGTLSDNAETADWQSQARFSQASAGDLSILASNALGAMSNARSAVQSGHGNDGQLHDLLNQFLGMARDIHASTMQRGEFNDLAREVQTLRARITNSLPTHSQ